MTFSEKQQKALELRTLNPNILIHKLKDGNAHGDDPDRENLLLGEILIDPQEGAILFGMVDPSSYDHTSDVQVQSIVKIKHESVGKDFKDETAYERGDIVSASGLHNSTRAYVATLAHGASGNPWSTPSDVADTKGWALLSPGGQAYQSGSTQYQEGDIVSFNQKIYRKLPSNFVSYSDQRDPDVNILNWKDIDEHSVQTISNGINGATEIRNIVSISQIDYDGLSVPRHPATIFIIK